MKITLNIDDATAAVLEREAQARGISLSQLLNNLVLEIGAEPVAAATEMIPALPPIPPPRDLGGVPDFDYNKALAILDNEDAAAYRATSRQ